jgi:hypothetical protein
MSIPKKIFVFAFLSMLVSFFSTISGAEKYGPTVTLKEELRIEDDGEAFFFKYPKSPVVDRQGFIFVRDQNQLLMFSPTGDFEGNFFKKGQGPFEMTNVTAIWPETNHIAGINRYPDKIILFNRKGKAEKEIKIPGNLGYAEFVSKYSHRFYFFKEKYHETKNKAVYTVVQARLFSFDQATGKTAMEKLWFPKKYFVMNTDWIMNVHFVQMAKSTHDHTVFIAFNGDYDIHRLDLKKMEFLPFIKREYKKVAVKSKWKRILKPVPFPHEGPAGKEERVFERKNLDDVQRILINGDKIWILTSTFNEDNRIVRVDTYDMEGKELGRFGLRMPEGFYLFKMFFTPMTLQEQKIYIFVSTEEGNLVLARYKFDNLPVWAKPGHP